MIVSCCSDVGTVREQQRHLPRVDEIIDRARRGIIDDSMATLLLTQLQQSERRDEPGPDEPPDQPRQAPA